MRNLFPSLLAALAFSLACSGGDGGGQQGTYSISGDVSGLVKAGVTVSLTGASTATTITDAAGHYSFSGVRNGSYTVAPSRAGGYVFSPASASVTVNGANVGRQNFTSTGAFSIAGTVSLPSGGALSGVAIALSGSAAATTTTDVAGVYSFGGLANGTYAVAPSRTGYDFNPANLSINLNGESSAARDFAAHSIFTISGSVSGLVKAGVTVALSGASTATTTTDSSGSYSFADVPEGNYTLTPSLPGGYVFSPASISVTVSGAHVTGQNFSDSGAYGISGTISGLVRTGVTVVLGGASSAITTTDSSGNYSFSGLPNGAYTLTPSRSGGYVFSPASLSVTVNGAGLPGQDFADTGAYGISGSVFLAAGGAFAGATVTMNGIASTTTDSSGAFTFTGLPNGTYQIAPTPTGYGFAPKTRSVVVNAASAAGVTFTSCDAIHPTGSTAVAYQIDPAHTGAQSGDALSLPLCQRWSRDLGAPVSFSLVANGRVFVTIGATGTANTSLVALDQQTGNTLWGPLDLGGTYFRGGAAYENGMVFAVNTSGVLRAVDAATGTTLWSGQLPGQYMFSSPPTASGGRVYVSGSGGGGTVYAVEELDGGVAWTASVANGDQSSPAVSDAGVFVSYACNQAYGFQPGDGGLLWHYSTSCSGGGGKTAALSGGRVYTRDFNGNLVLDAADGGLIDTYSSAHIPAFSGTSMLVTPSDLVSRSLAGSTAWTFDAGSTPIHTAPIVVGPHVVIGTPDGNLYVLDSNTGAVVSSDALPGILGPDEQNVSAPLAGFSAADGMLFVPAGNKLVAY